MPEQRQAKLAFIGCGGFASASIFPQIRLVPEIDLVAVCDVVKEKAERNARYFGARRVYTDMEKMLNEEQLDGVFVIGPAPQQYQLAPAVLKRGIPVYVEKPSANLSSEAKELAQLAEAKGTWGQCGFMKRFADVYTIAQEIVNRPEFGPIHVVKAKFGQGAYPKIWGIDSAKRAMLIGQLVHIFDLVRFFGGDVSAVHAMFRQVTDTNFAYAVNLQFASGAIGQLD
ncbi:MAG: Gfo/Idh/MocA family oxidoreductase, partial [Planctomycetes bacterium]|nr:Gfo/Idh/MocA family oxidoreductase [Planctomycetota bacterium]